MILQQLQETLQRHLGYLEQDPLNKHLQLTIGLLKARILHHQQNIPEAIITLEQLINQHPGSDDLAGLLSLLYFDHHDASRAESFSKHALAINPENYEARLVHMLLRTLNNDTTPEEINTLIQVNAHDSRLWFALGSAWMHRMNIHDAIQAFSQATSLWPHFFAAWTCLGWCHLLQDDIIKAEQAYLQAMRIDANAADSHAGLALVCALQNKDSEAKQYLEQAMMIDPACSLIEVTKRILLKLS